METNREHVRDARDLDPFAFDYWYHTIELPDGRTTPGEYDHRRYLRHYGFPADLQGMSVLDVGTADGFFAFEFERRGASKVVALDLDPLELRHRFQEAEMKHPDRFLLLRDLLGSQVEYHYKDVYDLSPEDFGLFDLVFCGSLLLHLSDPIRALRNIRSVTRGAAIVVTGYNGEPVLRLYEAFYRSFLRAVGSSKRPSFACFNWSPDIYWLPTRAGLLSMMAKAGFSLTRVKSSFWLLPVAGRHHGMLHLVIHANP